jgi:hypothetical protein
LLGSRQGFSAGHAQAGASLVARHVL